MLGVLLFFVTLAHAEGPAPVETGPSGLCPALIADYYQEGATGLRGNPYADLIATLPEALRDRAANRDEPNSLAAMESDVVALFEVDPSLRDLEAFRSRWGLTPEQTHDVLVFYAVRIWDNRFDLVGSTPDVLQRLRGLARAQYLLTPPGPDSAPARYLFYLTQVTRRSVPEIAELLSRNLGRPFTEGQVYEELSDLGISLVGEASLPLTEAAAGDAREALRTAGHVVPPGIVAAGLSRLDIAAALVRRNVPVPDVARALGFGEAALRFVLDHTDVMRRGVEWQRVIRLPDGRVLTEIEYLVELRAAGESPAEIAAELNRLLPPTAPGGADRRTEASVKTKLRDLGLTPGIARTAPDRFHRDYGYLKRHGQLVPEPAIRFLFDHHRRDDAWLAEQLGVRPDSLRDFYTRHSLVRVGGTGPFEVRLDVDRRVRTVHDRYARQIAETDAVVDFIHRTGRAPRQDEFNSAPELLGMNDSRFYGTGAYSPAGASGHLRTFSSREEALLAIRARARERGLDAPIRLFDFRSPPSSPFVRLLGEEAADEYLRYAQTRGRFPTQADIDAGPLLTSLPRFFGLAEHSPGKAGYNRRYHDSVDDGFRTLERRARALGLRPPWHTFVLKAPQRLPDWVLELAHRQLAEDYLAIYIRRGGNLAREDFGPAEGQLHVEMRKFLGTDNYGPGRGQRHQAIFGSRAEALVYIAALAEASGLRYSVLDVPLRAQDYTPEYRALRTRHAVDRYLDWVVQNGRHPRQSDFGNAAGKLALGHALFYGNGDPTAFFTDRAAANAAVVARAAQRNLTLPGDPP